MMGKFYVFCLAMMVCAPASAQYYKVTIKTVGDKLAFPNADFTLEAGTSQMKGFEARINATGFGASGFKPSRLEAAETKAKYEKLLNKELSRKPEEKIAAVLEALEIRARTLEMRIELANDGSKKPSSRNSSVAKPEEAPKSVAAALSRQRMNAHEAVAKFEKFKQDVEKAKRTPALMKEMIAEIDAESKSNIIQKMLRESVHVSGYPYGTFCSIDLKKIDGAKAVVNFEYAVSFIAGWIKVEGNNNDNSMNSVLDMEYVEMPLLKDIAIPLGKPYCFQIARPVDKGGSLAQARGTTNIFSESGTATEPVPEVKEPDPATVLADYKANALNMDGLYSDVQRDFKGNLKDVIRVIVTIDKM